MDNWENGSTAPEVITWAPEDEIQNDIERMYGKGSAPDTAAEETPRASQIDAHKVQPTANTSEVDPQERADAVETVKRVYASQTSKEGQGVAESATLGELLKVGEKRRQALIEELKQYEDRSGLAFVAKEIGRKYGITQKLLKSIIEDLEGDAEAEKAAALAEITDPWDEPVQPKELIREIYRTLDHYVVCSVEGKITLSMWALLTWFYNETVYAPPLVITAPEKGCGKSSVAYLIKDLSCKSIYALSPTPAVIYRVKEKIDGVSLFFDEADTFFKTADSKQISSIINAGVIRDGQVLRCDKDARQDMDVKGFNCFGFHAVIGIGCDTLLENTLLDRSLVIRLDRATNEQCRGIGDYQIERELGECAGNMAILRRKCAAFRDDYRQAFKDRLMFYKNKENAANIQNRQRQKWIPLLALADVITMADKGGPDPEREVPETGANGKPTFKGQILKACQALTAEDKNLSRGEELIADIGRVFMMSNYRGWESISADVICRELNDPKNEFAYSEYNGGKGIKAQWLRRRISEKDRGGDCWFRKDNKSSYKREGIIRIMQKYLPEKTVQEILNGEENK
jgi:putative DNA primase/helicase